MRKVVVSASSLSAGRNMSAQIEYITRVGNYGADMYHIDVIDGVFAKNKTIDYKYFEQLREKSPLLFDVHLMVANPEKVVDKYIKAGANILSVHYESFKDPKELIKVLKKIRKNGVMAGLIIDLDTKVEVVDSLLKYADVVVVMTVKAGKGGQAFNKSALKKIKYIRKLNPEILISADGGIDADTGAQCVRAGADILVSGSYIYKNDAYESIQKLKGKNG